MKKQRPVTLPKISADAIAKNIKQGMGLDRARKVADSLYRNFKDTGTADLSGEFSNVKDIRKSERIWFQVRNILANQKGFTVIELLVFLSFIATAVLGVGALYVLAHFLAKLW